jgi:flagellar basal-body rod modification protein FlgD
MTTINSDTTAGAGTAATPITGLGTDYTMFLKLLTTQMQHQDPLDPMDTSEYTQQLVQYSQVEQSIQQTGALKDILSQLSSQQMSQASSYIGHEARFDSAIAGLGEDPATWTYYVDGEPAAIKATITDASGAVVNEVSLDPETQGRFEWDGTKSDGTRAAEGAYTLALAVTNTAGQKLDVTINSAAKVTDVVSSGGEVMLGVNGIRMPLYGLVGISSVD